MTKFTGCTRCQARRAAGRGPCRAPAVRGQRVCRFHGGLSTGPKTAAGRMVSASRFFQHGRETRAIRDERSASLGRLMQIEDIFRLYGLISGLRTRGPKPKGYRPICTFEDAALWLYGKFGNPRGESPAFVFEKYAPES